MLFLHLLDCLISLLVFSIHPFYQEDWSRTIAEIDKFLFSKYGLTEEEITFIKKNGKTKVEERKTTPLLPSI